MNLPRLLPVWLALAAVAFGAETPADSALALYKARKYPDAQAAFEKIAAAEPGNGAAQFYLGMLAEKRNKIDAAVAYFERAVEIDPKNSDYLTQLGGAYGLAAQSASLFSQLSLARKCRDTLERAVALNPNDLEAHNILVSFYRQAPSIAGGSLDKAREHAEAIRQRNPTMGAVVEAQIYVSEKKYDEAFALFDDVLRKEPSNYIALFSIGRTAAQTGGHLDEGEKALRRCLELTPAEGEPGPAPVHWRLGNIAEKRGNRDAARAEYEAALKIDPAFKQARASLGNVK